MIDRAYSIAEVQEQFTHLPEQLEQEPGVMIVTQHGKPALAILRYNIFKEILETIEELQETLEIIQDKELMASFREGVKELSQGKGISWEDAKKNLGWE